MTGRIAVLGGGVSGLSFAAAMKRHAVTVFEREPRVGGKSCTVEIDGRAHDLGATMGVPYDYRDVLSHSAGVGIQTERFPDEQHYSLATGKPVPLNRWRELPRVLWQAARYVRLHRSWRGVDGKGLHEAHPSLYRPWSELIARHDLHEVNRRTLAYRTGYGYGFDDEIPAVLYANLFRPETFWGLARKPALMWSGGTQPIWERLAQTLDDVRTSSPIERIRRDVDGVTIESGGRSERFDALVITVNPREALRVLDASDEERHWFSQVKTYPYSTVACEVTGLTPGRTSVGYLDDNMTRDRAGHPMAWVKRYADRDIFVFHLFAPESLSDADLATRIGQDVARLGGRLVRVCASRRWAFFPHFPSAFMVAGGLSQIERWQGTRRTYLIGEVLSFATMARVSSLAKRLAQRMTTVSYTAMENVA